MVKKISISISDHIYEQYLSHITINRSQYIERLIMLGGDLEAGSIDRSKANNLILVQDNRNKDEEIKKLKAEIGRLKKQIKPEESPEEIKARQFAKGWRKAGMNRKIAEKMPL